MYYIKNLKEGKRKVEDKLHLMALRKIAKKMHQKLIESQGKSTLTSKDYKQIKEYSKAQFGSSSYWPWLALYSEARGEFLSGWIPEDYYRVKLLKKYNPDFSSGISSYKSFDNVVFPDFSLETLLYIYSGKIYDKTRSSIRPESAYELLCKRSEHVIIKPELGSGGKGISFTSSREVDLIELSNSGDYVIQSVFEQHESLSKVHPESLNTLRVFTYINDKGDVEVKFTYLKFGVEGERVDNGSSGGGLCFVNRTGELENQYYNIAFEKCGEKHPDSKISMNQIRIPNLSGVFDSCKKAHQRFPYVKFIGWDVAVGIDTKPVLIEWNARYPMLAYGEALFGPLWNEKPV